MAFMARSCLQGETTADNGPLVIDNTPIFSHVRPKWHDK